MTVVLAILGLLACQAQEPAAPPANRVIVKAPEPSPAASQRVRYDLGPDETRGGHTLARHVGRSDADLRDRLRRESGISAASTYTDRTTAERVVAVTLTHQRSRVDQWLSRQGPRPNLALNYRGTREPIGRSLARRGQRSVDCYAALVVLRWDGRRGFYVLTSYPEARR